VNCFAEISSNPGHPSDSGIEVKVFVPPQRRLGPRIIIIALAIMIFGMVYLLVQRRNQKPTREAPVQQLQQENRSGSAFTPQ
jgi:hypothetical protein